jgi:hypothetical protein
MHTRQIFDLEKSHIIDCSLYSKAGTLFNSYSVTKIQSKLYL